MAQGAEGAVTVRLTAVSWHRWFYDGNYYSGGNWNRWPDIDDNQDEMMDLPEEEFSEPFISVEQMPMWGDCKDETCTQTEIMKYIARNFRYPEIAKANGVEGRVILEFVVEKDGKVGRIKILRGLDKHVDKACIDVVEDFPIFSPGKQIGKPVPVKYTVPIKCTLG